MTNPNWPVVVDRMDVTNDPTSATTTWTDLVDAAGNSLVTAFSCRSGRTYELARTDTGVATVQVENSDGRFDPKNAASPLNLAGKRLLPMRRYSRQATWDGVSYDVWTGFVERYPQSWAAAGFLGAVAMTCVDACAPLARVDLPSLYEAEVLSDNPTLYVPLTEPAESSSVGDLSAERRHPVAARASKQGPGTFGLGSEAGPVAGTTALTLAPGDSYGTGYLLPLEPVVPLVGAATMEIWVRFAPQPPVSGDILIQRDTAYQGWQMGFALSQTTGVVTAAYADPYTGGVLLGVETPGSVADDEWHHLVLTIDAAQKVLRLYIDGIQVDTDTSVTAVTPRYAPGTLDLGGTRNAAYFAGAFAHAAVYTTDLSAARVLAHYNAGLGHVGDGSGTRSARYLDAIGWPLAGRDIDSGNSTVGDYDVNGTPAMQAIGDLAEWEAGNFFIAPDGKVTFRQRDARFNAPSVATFGDGPGELPYEGNITFDFDNTEVYNDVKVDRIGGATVRVVDDVSEDTYFPSSLTQTVGIDSDAQTVDRANYLLGAYKDPRLRCERITIVPSSNPSLWPQALGRKIGDRITVNKHAGPAPDLSGDFFIEAVEHDNTEPGRWATTWQLSPAGAGVSDFWVVEDPVFGYIEGSGANVSYPIAF